MANKKKKDGMVNPRELIKCDMHEDCLACDKGKCIALSDNDFGGRDCPFYKPLDSVDEVYRQKYRRGK